VFLSSFLTFMPDFSIVTSIRDNVNIHVLGYARLSYDLGGYRPLYLRPGQFLLLFGSLLKGFLRLL
jgi:hypothetical protein